MEVRWVTWLLLTLQLVKVIAGNDVIAFNQEQEDVDDNIDAILEREQFIQVVPAHSKKPPHPPSSSTHQLKAYQNSSSLKDNFMRDSNSIRHSDAGRRQVTSSFQQQNTHKTYTSHPAGTKMRQRPGNMYNGGNTSLSTLPQRSPKNNIPVMMWEELSPGDSGNEDKLIGMENLLLSVGNTQSPHSRHKRQAPDMDVDLSGAFLVEAQITLSGTLTTEEASDGSRENQALKDELETAIWQFLQRINSNIVTVNVVTLTPGSIVVDMVVQVLDEASIVDVAEAFVALDNTGNFTAGGQIYDVSKPVLENITESTSGTENKLRPVICYTLSCAIYQSCLQAVDETYFCGFPASDKFYPYGPGQGDRTLPREDEFTTAEITIDSGIPYGNQLYTTIYISVNGIISFNVPFAAFYPQRLPALDNRGNQRLLLAPYWSDLDLVNGDIGEVYYQLYLNGGTNSGNVANIFSRANSEVLDFDESLSTYDASSVLVVTWYEIPPFPGQFSATERVNFQCVIISDGQSTYATYIYGFGAMNFNPDLQRDVEIGWGKNSFATENARATYYMFDKITGNTNVNGMWFFKIGTYSNSAAKCLAWYTQNLNSINVINVWNQLIPPCPCNQIAAALSILWIPSFERANCFEISPLFGNVGRRCCYQRNLGGFENRIPNAGSLQLFTPYYGDLLSHYVFDTQPKQWCCVESTIYCPLYYQLRPRRGCSGFLSQRGLFFGDPHITTFDSKTYDFNGVGEYTLIKIVGFSNATESSLDFILQGRTCQARNSDGSLSLATVFCALAVKNNNTNTTSGSSTVSTVSVEIGEYPNGTNYVILFVNKEDYTVRFRDNENFARFNGGVYLRRENSSLKISTPSNIGLTVQVNNGLLEFSVELDKMFNGATVGLMGNFNGNPDDDFVYPNDTVLPANATEREIFDFGQAWQITAAESLFQYPYGQNASSFRNDSFTPIFISEITQDQRQAAEQVCGANSTKTQACIFDYVATQNKDVAAASKTTQETFVLDDEKINNQAPTILAGEGRINTIVGQTTTVRFEATDPDNGSVTYSLVSTPHPNVTASVVNGAYQVVFTPTDLNSATEIAVVAIDDKNVSSQVAEVEIVQCSGCNNHGSCNFNKIKSTDNPYFSVAACDCYIGYSGVDCENDKDGCANAPCPQGTTCTDVAAVNETATGMAYSCSECPDGYKLNTNKTKCSDINECDVSPSICGNNSNCFNIIGSYRCECKSGYRKSSLGRCVDINECVENQYDCNQICINTIGSYKCGCEDGFMLAVDNTACIQTSVDPCKDLADGNRCSYGCRNASGVAQCFCPLGFKLAGNGIACEDIDECAQRLCSQVCQNSNGSYQCSCLDGYVLGSDSLSCEPCPFNMYGPNCTKTCECRGHARLCDKVKGCICLDGWTGQNCEKDVDECELNTDLCSEEQVCKNNNGSYTCDCPTGYEETFNNGSCYNIDECLSPDVNGCDQGCVDNPGSYTCVCYEGYIYNINTGVCEDIDECSNGVSGCAQLCDNMQGSYNCRCQPGFTLGDDRKSCVEVPEINPCEGLSNSCDYGCIVENGAPHCFCRIGYQLSSNGLLCIDINECELENMCSDVCVNKVGSYSCSCPKGKKLQNDSRTCQVCDDYHWGENCTNQCACNPKGAQSCHPINGCVCNAGWRGTQCSEDRDECSESLCDASAICTNTAGSYKCTCKSGYQLDTASQQCVDIDECTTALPCDHYCNNTIGGYTCSCYAGFLKDGDDCIDIDECANKDLNLCDQLCRNTQGNFMCECYPGFVLNITTRHTCDRDPEAVSCLDTNTCSDFCRVEDGRDTCFCSPGYQLNVSDNVTCIDVNECDNSPCINGTCDNFDGGYNCSCSDGTKLEVDKITCMVCEPGTYGKDCDSLCMCNETSTESCDPVDGTCTCSDGWEGNDCSTDINECKQSPDPVDCGSNAHCVDDPGSYRCVCDIGYFRSGDQCLACDATSYGENCGNICACITANTADCDNVNGSCTCNSGWEGNICDTDINECLTNKSYCSGPNEVCVNLNGSARCDCSSGYARPNPSDNCQDINECLLPTLVCTDTTKRCSNMEGSYDCVCKDGYLTNDDGSCTVNFEGYFVQITIGYTINLDWFDTTTNAFNQLQQQVEEALTNYGRGLLGEKLLSVTVFNFYYGSVKANTSITINKQYSDNPPGDAARLFYELDNDETLNINGENVSIGAVIPGASNDSSISDTSVCGFLDELEVCGSNEACSIDDDGYPQCTADDSDSDSSSDSNNDLIIGLSVGIPLFFILTITIAILVYLYVKRRAKEDLHSSTPSVAREDPFNTSVFATKMATKGSWGAPHRFQMYSPDAYSEAGTSDSSGNDGQLLRTRRSSKSEFQDSPWFESRGTTPRDAAEGQGASTEGGPTSNFSWEYMFQLLEPHKGFEIQRPNINASPIPPHSPRSRRPDSMA